MIHQYVIYDMDNTISDARHRSHLAMAKQWDDFQLLAPQDITIDPIVKLLKMTARVAKNIICTGRDVKYIQQTMDWLMEKDISAYIHDLIMRPSGDWSSDHELKIRMLEIYFGGRQQLIDKVWFVVEDRDRNVEAMRNIGLTVLQPCAGAY